MTAIDQSSSLLASVVELGRFQIDLEARLLLQDGVSVPIGSRAFDILAILVSADGRLVTKEELLSAVWPRTIVEENNIHVHLSCLRKILGPDRKFVVTVPGRGYRIHSQRPVRDAYSRTDSSGGHLKSGASLVGRDAAIEQIDRLLKSSRQVTLVGAGGIGKTKVAFELVRRARDDASEPIYVAELSTVTTRESVLKAILKSFEREADDAALSVERVACAVSDSHGILLIDNAEHVVEHVAEIVEALVGFTEYLRVLVTSREPLRIVSESVFRVEPLETPRVGATGEEILEHSAVSLFRQRADAVQGVTDVDERHIQLVGEICRRLDGIPLAIELAAARVAAFGLEGVRRGLDDRMAFLTSGYRTALPRHQTLRASFDWSYALLGCDERALFRRIAVFDATFTLDDLCIVACDATFTVESARISLEELVAKSLVNVRRVGTQVLYHMYESTRAYALQKLEAEGEAQLIASRRERRARTRHDSVHGAGRIHERSRMGQSLSDTVRDALAIAHVYDADRPLREVLRFEEVARL